MTSSHLRRLTMVALLCGTLLSSNNGADAGAVITREKRQFPMMGGMGMDCGIGCCPGGGASLCPCTIPNPFCPPGSYIHTPSPVMCQCCPNIGYPFFNTFMCGVSGMMCPPGMIPAGGGAMPMPMAQGFGYGKKKK